MSLQLGITHKGKQAILSLHPGDALLFWDGFPVAVMTGAVVYFMDGKILAACTKAINAFAGQAAIVRAADADFDFLVGSLLTKAGLPLTRRG